jgi:hypothetical protein
LEVCTIVPLHAFLQVAALSFHGCSPIAFFASVNA